MKYLKEAYFKHLKAAKTIFGCGAVSTSMPCVYFVYNRIIILLPLETEDPPMAALRAAKGR